MLQAHQQATAGEEIVYVAMDAGDDLSWACHRTVV